ncbi:MAG: glucose 1-dehydrogenase [Gammaproteobacteria bacterium]|nr:glucose 1-dehydrogenase [Gammaproteobacteria bacterium]
MRFNDKVVIVTGGGTGIGASISEQFAMEGAHVVVAQRRMVNIRNVTHIFADLCVPDHCERVIQQTIQQFGKLDVLVNNAGIMLEAGIGDMSLESWEKVMALNLTAPFLLCKHAIAYLKETNGSIVNIGSIEGLSSNPKHSAYCASKAGVHAMTKSIAVDHGEDGIRCNAVAPGWIDTDLNVDFIESMPNSTTFRKDIGKIHPIGRTGKPSEIAALVCWLASEEASFITGQVFVADGGRMAKLSLPM